MNASLRLRHHLADRPSDVVAIADHPDVRIIDELKDMVRAAQDGNEAGRLLE